MWSLLADHKQSFEALNIFESSHACAHIAYFAFSSSSFLDVIRRVSQGSHGDDRRGDRADFAPAAKATAYYWGTTNGTWQVAGNWTTDPTGSTIVGSGIPAQTDTVIFNGSAIFGNETISLNAATSVLGMTFANTGTTVLKSDTTTARILTIGTGGITINSGAGAVTIGDATNGTTITLGGTQTWTNNSANTLTIANAVTMGTNPLTIDGTGTTTINGVIGGTVASGTTALTIGSGAGSTTRLNLGTAASTFTGNILINGGTLSASMSGGAATSPLGGQIGTVYRMMTLQNGGTYISNVTWNDNLPTTTNVGVVFNFGTGGGTLNVASGTTLTLDDGSGTGTASGAAQLQGSGTLTKTGAGTLTLGNGTSNFSNFTGAIIISAGTLTTGTASTNPLGDTVTGTTIAAGADIDLKGVVWTQAEPLNISGAGVGGTANVIRNSSTTAASFAGPITLARGVHIGRNCGHDHALRRDHRCVSLDDRQHRGWRHDDFDRIRQQCRFADQLRSRRGDDSDQQRDRNERHRRHAIVGHVATHAHRSEYLHR
ncbi:MAG: autotransporter-associated beta strand repeat-containing protein [Pirellulales bacterium]